MVSSRFGSFLLLAICSLACATPLAPHLTEPVLKSRHPAPPRYIKRGHAHSDHTLSLRIGLKQKNLDVVRSRLWEASTPGSSAYGKHLSQSELRTLVAPEESTVAAVKVWLEAHEINDYEISASDWVKANVPVHVAERLLSTQYYDYEDPETGHVLVRTEEYRVPEGVSAHVDVIQPTNYFGSLHKMANSIHSVKNIVEQSAEVDAVTGCSSIITPTCLRNLYNTAGYTATTSAGFGIAGYLQEYASHSDLSKYISKYRTDITSASFTVVTINGTYDENDPGDEANLDVQTAIGVAYPTPVTYTYTDGSPPFIADESSTSNTNEPYITWTDYQLSLGDGQFDYTVSTSYGDDEQTVPYDYAVKVCDAFMQMGARGQTLLFASGDDGVGPSASECVSSTDGSSQFLPGFPASCPYVTAVGGTHKTSPEVAVDWSGAGFSNYFSCPKYQESAVSSYISTVIGSSYSGLYNSSGRAYPDISAQAVDFGIYIGGSLSAVSGTSAATPAAAAVFSQLNDYLVSKGRSPLGFANPFIYANTHGFNDITSGASSGCGTNGFSTATGWDASTGVGTPDFVKLRALLG